MDVAVCYVRVITADLAGSNAGVDGVLLCRREYGEADFIFLRPRYSRPVYRERISCCEAAVLHVGIIARQDVLPLERGRGR